MRHCVSRCDMIFDLKEVFEREGAAQTVSFQLAISDIELDGAYPFTSPAKVTATAANKTGIVNLSIDTEFEYSRPCDRCMKPLSDTLKYSFEHRLIATLCGDDDGDYIETPDFTLELDEVVISDIILHYPQKFLCSEDCKGLCPVCGKNRNEGDCGCERQNVDPRLEILKQLMKE